MKIISSIASVLSTALLLVVSCSNDSDPVEEDLTSVTPDPVEEKVYDETGCLYTSYTNLVMAGYQGWFAAEGDESNRGWYHYKNDCGFYPGCSSIDMWPDMTEYDKSYITPFSYSDGSPAYLYSPYDIESIDLHFKWMKDHGIDGVHMQRFVAEIHPSNEKGRRHFNKVLESALIAAKKYDRAISVMYDLSGSSSDRVAYVEQDWNTIVNEFDLFNNLKHPTYLRHNGKPLMSVWGVGFNDGRDYSIADVDQLVTRLKGPTNKVSIMLGVPYYWRTMGNDTENDPGLHTLIRKVDIIMPWAVGRYKMESFDSNNILQDISWTNSNDVDYVPVIFPGFSWGNLRKDPLLYDQIPRHGGEFLWKQVAGAKLAGAESLYVAMFDEIDEGTAIFKVSLENNVPMNGNDGGKFIGLDETLRTDHYLWLTGQAANWFHQEGEYGVTMPQR
ncbi:xylosidase [Robertkochia marina]|uniref:Xylosidase n=1 Tax=Robertkochia marina TaxID=1227945 RepID=A0A4S3LZS4_9FLAO|nr:glycoside hydrolase family 71/99-like protein [Robertkochia marina]THD66815.1 xylosidase [Robertkochia marina]TRZ40882.1 xylosidase [Robertkochia marina]